MFCNINNRQELALGLSLNYYMKCKRHVIALLDRYALAIVVEAIDGINDNDATMEIKVSRR